MRFTIRTFQPADAVCVDDLWRQAFAGFEDDFEGAGEALARGAARVAATGWRIFVAGNPAGTCSGAIRCWDEEGVAWFDLLVAGRPFAGRPLVREVERWAQTRGFRTVRTRVPEDPGLLTYFAMLGYLEIGATDRSRLLERRLPLLTVREQRREDAAAIAALAGVDPWPLEQGHRPGWFVLADGAAVVGVAVVAETGFGEATIHTLVLEGGYRRRGIETWMLARAGGWAATNGFHTIAVPARLVEAVGERDLEDAGWFRDAERFVLRDPVPTPP